MVAKLRKIGVLGIVGPCLILAGCGSKDKDKDRTAEAEGPGSGTTAAKPDAVKPDAVKPDAVKPDAVKPDAVKPDTAQLYYERPLTREELKTRSLRELSLMRNTIFARGGNTFRKGWLNQYFTKKPWYQAADKLDKNKISDTDWKNIKTIAEVERTFSTAELDARKSKLLEAIGSGQPNPEQRVELELLSRRVGKWVGPAQVAVEQRSALEDPSQLEKILELQELDDMSRKDLRILRNTIYARRGYVFKSPILTDYFSNMDWYQADPAYSDDRLSQVDWKNIKLVKSVENNLGGPIDDKDHQNEDLDWFDAA